MNNNTENHFTGFSRAKRLPKLLINNLLAGTLLLAASQTHAALSDPISFSQAGTVTLTLDLSVGGYDHILEMATGTGPIGTPLMALTETPGTPSPDVLGYTPASIGDSISLGYFAASQELIFRLTNVESIRLGTPGTLGDQTFTGSSAANNPSPGDHYSHVNFIDPLTIQVSMEDLFPISPLDPDPENAFLTGGVDVVYTLTLTPVPVPAAAWLFGTGLLGLVGVARRRISNT